MTADAFAHVGRREEAARAAAEWDRLQQDPQPRDRIIRRRIEALVHDRQAAEALEGAVKAADDLGFVLEALWTRIDLGTALAARDRERARRVLEFVAERAAEAGALTEQQVAEQRLRALGVRTWRRGAATRGLTDREREIVRLIANGASNPEIAQRLFLSRKTVERHVSNLLKKVGARNRAELAARVAELEVEGAHR
jgi:DNA-binding NarL/FixJ family response regulator